MNTFLGDSLFINGFHLILTTFSTSLLGFIFWVVAARYYSSDEVGLASAIISSMNFLAILSLLGFNISLIRYLPRSNNKEDLINSCLTLCIFTAFIISSTFILGCNFHSLIPIRTDNIHSIIFIIITIFSVFTILLTSIFISCKSSKYVLVKDSVFGISKIIVLFFLGSFGALGIFISWGLGLLVASIFGIIFIYKMISPYTPTIIVKQESIINMFYFSFGNYIANIFYNMPALVLPILIANLLSPNEAAYFYISWMIANLLFAVPSQFSQSLFAEGSNNENEIDDTIIKAIKVISMLLVPAILFILFFGDRLLLLFGREYSMEGFKLMQILSISAIPFTVNSIYIAIKRVRKETLAVVTNYCIVAFITLIGSYLMLSRVGVIGAGISWALGNSIAVVSIGVLIIKNKIRL